MELHLHMQSHHFARRAPDWRAAAIAGLIAGTLYVVLELLTARFVLYQGAWGTVKMVAAIMLGREALASADAFSWTIVLAAGVVHFALSVVLATILAMIIASFRFDSSIGMATMVGALFGLLAYLVNFYVLGRYFNWFDEARGWESVFAHILFGLIAADAYTNLERRAPDSPGMAGGG
ncbi:membrane protein [Burkholderiaceae bacterium 16]|nr:membrane protein [Burkholderiaceae bacterium 16]